MGVERGKMQKLSDVRIAKKLALSSGASVIQLACVAAIDARRTEIPEPIAVKLSASEQITQEVERVDDQCQLGKWRYGAQLSASEKQSGDLVTVRGFHAKFHESASTAGNWLSPGSARRQKTP